MHIFIDESGSFAYTPNAHSISVVGALIIPDSRLPDIEKKYLKLRARLPQKNDEVKGRLLSESDIDRVVTLLVRNEALFEVTANDMGLHSEADVSGHKKGQEIGMTAHLTDEHRPSVHEGLWHLRKRLEWIPHQLYVQTVVTFELIARVIEHGTMFFSQRQPIELRTFHWVVMARIEIRLQTGKIGGHSL